MISLIDSKQEELTALCRPYRVRSLELFGFAARGDFEAERSDPDFLVEFEPLPVGERADACFGLLESLEALFGRPVDLVVLRAIRNPCFLDNIASSRTSLYAA